MKYKMEKEELDLYLKSLQNPSDAFLTFLYDYVEGDGAVRALGEEDVSVWNRMTGEELSVAKQIILDVLERVPDISYIQAAGIFRDIRAIPILMTIIENSTVKQVIEKLYAARSLYYITEDSRYYSILMDACKDYGNTLLNSYFHVSISVFLEGLREKEKIEILNALYQKS